MTVTGFDQTKDALELILEGTRPTDITVDVADVDGGGVMYSYSGVDIASIENVTALQTETANVSFADAPSEEFLELETWKDAAQAAFKSVYDFGAEEETHGTTEIETDTRDRHSCHHTKLITACTSTDTKRPADLAGLFYRKR